METNGSSPLAYVETNGVELLPVVICWSHTSIIEGCGGRCGGHLPDTGGELQLGRSARLDGLRAEPAG